MKNDHDTPIVWPYRCRVSHADSLMIYQGEFRNLLIPNLGLAEFEIHLTIKTLTINLPEEVELHKVKMIISASRYEQGIFSSGLVAELAGLTSRQFLEEVGKYGLSIFGETAQDLEKVGDFAL